MNKILVVDDHAVVRGGIRQFLTDSMEGYEVFEASSGREALELIRTTPWDLILLDIGLDDINGLEVLRRIKSMKSNLTVLIFSMFDEDEYAMIAIERGAAGYLPKDSKPEEILHAIHQVSLGRRYLSEEFTSKLLSGNLSEVKKLPHDQLSEREFEVMLMINAGSSLVNIGNQLNLSPKTITTFRSRIFSKLGVSSNADLARYVITHRLGN
jgi:DNA-binding NarL/FixJ family response regulator